MSTRPGTVATNYGYQPSLREVWLVSRAAVSRGDVMEIDWTASDSDVNGPTDATTPTPLNEKGAINANAVATSGVMATHMGVARTYVVAMEDIAADAVGRFAVEGIVEVSVIAASGSPSAGDALVAVTSSQNLDLVKVTNEPILGICMDEVTTPTTAELATVWFKGDDGFHGLAN